MSNHNAAIMQSLPIESRRLGLLPATLDTSAALLWMKLKVHFLILIQLISVNTDEDDYDAIPRKAKEYGAIEARLVDCRQQLAYEVAAIQSGAFHVHSGGMPYFNTTPLGRAVTDTMLIAAMKEDDVHIWGDGSTYKGNDIERFYRYGLLTNPQLKIYKPWLDQQFIDELGGRRGNVEFLITKTVSTIRCQSRRPIALTRICLAHHEAKDLEFLETSMKIVEPIMGVAYWDEAVEIKWKLYEYASRGRARGA